MKAIGNQKNFTQIIPNGSLSENVFNRRNPLKFNMNNLNTINLNCFQGGKNPHATTTFDKLELENIKANKDKNNFINFERKKLKKKNNLFLCYNDKYSSIKSTKNFSNQKMSLPRPKNKIENSAAQSNKIFVDKPEMYFIIINFLIFLGGNFYIR